MIFDKNLMKLFNYLKNIIFRCTLFGLPTVLNKRKNRAADKKLVGFRIKNFSFNGIFMFQYYREINGERMEKIWWISLFKLFEHRNAPYFVNCNMVIDIHFFRLILR